MVPTYFRRCSGIECFNGHRGFALFADGFVDAGPIASAVSDSTAVPSKATLRAAAFAARDALGATYRAAAAQAIAEQGLPFNIRPGMVIAGYAPIRSEADPMPLMRKFAAGGSRLALPVIVARDEPLTFRDWSGNDPLVRGPLGIPAPSAKAAEVIPDVVLVPLAAFDRSGHRIGYGAGYYDRSLAQLRRSKPVSAVGIAFAAQEIAMVPVLPHDVALDCVVTEMKMFDFRSQ